MDRHFALPIAIAAALHAGLLLGIHPATVTRVKNIVEKISPLDPIPTMPIDLLSPPERDAEAAPAKAEKTEPSPMSPEPLITETKSAFTIEVPRTPTIRPNGPIMKIGNTGLGVLNGIEGGRGPDILKGTELDSPPRTRVQVAPQYPSRERSAGITGEVLVEFTVDETGAVLSPRVVRSTDRAFEEPTLRAVAKWRFEPGRHEGRIVRFRMAVPVVFKLDSE